MLTLEGDETWCALCLLEYRLETARAVAAEIPALEAQVAHLRAGGVVTKTPEGRQ